MTWYLGGKEICTRANMRQKYGIYGVKDVVSCILSHCLVILGKVCYVFIEKNMGQQFNIHVKTSLHDNYGTYSQK